MPMPFGNFVFHMSNMLSSSQSMVYDYTKIFEIVSFLKTTIIHCNINRTDYFHVCSVKDHEIWFSGYLVIICLHTAM